MTDYQQLSETELLTLIEKAETALKNKQANKRKEVISKIKELAASIDVTVEIHEQAGKSIKSTIRIAAKYRHPKESDKTWTGRGIMPRWLKALIDQGHDLSEFKI